MNEFGGLSTKGKVGQTSGTDRIEAGEREVLAVYDLSGRKLAAPSKGINIVHYLTADGTRTVEKVLVK